MVLKDVRKTSESLKCDLNSKELRKALLKEIRSEAGLDMHTEMTLNWFFGLNDKYRKNK